MQDKIVYKGQLKVQRKEKIIINKEYTIIYFVSFNSFQALSVTKVKMSEISNFIFSKEKI